MSPRSPTARAQASPVPRRHPIEVSCPDVYRRNYLPDGEVDIITELGFSDRPAYEKWVATMYAKDSGVAEDEERFLDRTKTRSYIVDERVTR